MLAYDNGYLREFGTTSIKRWDTEVSTNTKKGVSSTLVGKHKYKLIGKYTDQVEENSPGYLHYLFRHAINVKGPKAGFAELAHSMEEKSKVPSESRQDIKVHRLQLNRWFIANGGTEISAKEKPLDTIIHCLERKMGDRKIWITYQSISTCCLYR